jgi:thiamine-monophosphate kinase
MCVQTNSPKPRHAEVAVLPDELSIIDRHFRPLAGEGAFNLRDDAGVIAPPPGREIVVTTDTIANEVHFLPGDPPDTIAKKALRVNLSDLAGKGATPLAYLLNLALSLDIDDAWLTGFSAGLREDQARYGIKLLGGDTIAVPDRTVISVTAFGSVPEGRMVRRSGGRPGDLLYVSGAIGLSALGLALLKGEEGPWSNLREATRDSLVRRYRVPAPPTQLAPVLLEFASAAMDVSDGLVGDCDKICAASACSAVIEAKAVPTAFSGSANRELLTRLLTAGEDFEVLAAVPSAQAAAFETTAAAAGMLVTRIGKLVEGSKATEVVFEGQPLVLSRRAFVHGGGERGR